MSTTSIAKADPSLASRYLADQVTDAERATIENDLITDPEFVRELEATARFKVGLQHLRETGRLDALMRTGATRTRYAVAAGLLVALIGSIYFTSRDDPALVLARSATELAERGGDRMAIASTHSVFRRRASTYDAVIDLPAYRGAVQIRVMPDMGNRAAPFDVALAKVQPDGQSQPVANVTSLHPAGDGFVSVFADSSLLTPGDYELAITSSNGARTSDKETFLIHMQPATAP